MAFFQYRAVDLDARAVSGRMEATDENELESRLRTKGLTLIEATRRGIRLGGAHRLREKDLLDFSYFLHLILSSGIPIMGGLSDMAEQEVNHRLARTARLISAKLESGKSISEAMQDYPDLFPAYYASMIRAGEASGSLEQILTDLMAHLEWQIALRKSLRDAMAYPVLVLTALALLITLLFTFVMPKFIKILTDLKVAMPLPTRILMGTASLFRDYWPLLLLLVLLIPVAYRFLRATERGALALDRLYLKLPLFGPLIRKLNHSRYFRTFATLYRAGLNMNDTLRVSADVVKNGVVGAEFNRVTTAVLGGEQLSSAFRAEGDFSPLLLNMVEIGEKTGALDTTMLRICEIYDKEIPETLKKIFSILEPVIILLLGCVVLVALASFFLPLYRIVGGLRR